MPHGLLANDALVPHHSAQSRKRGRVTHGVLELGNAGLECVEQPPVLPGPHSGVCVVCLRVRMLLVAVDLQKDPESGLTVTDDAKLLSWLTEGRL